jgi:predicted PurR-regulated permease PerM
MAGAIPSAVVNGAAGMTTAALVIAALYAGRDFLIPLALAGLLSFIPSPLVGRGCRSGAAARSFG